MTNPEIIIKTLDPDHWEAYRSFKLAMLKTDPQASHVSFEEENALPLDLWRQDIETANQKDKFIHVFALFGDAIVGMGSVFFSNKTHTQHAASIVSIHVDPKIRKMGAGQKIIEALVKEAKLKQVVKLELTVNTQQVPAINLYLKNGFMIVGLLRQTIFVNGRYYDEYVMEKFL